MAKDKKEKPKADIVEFSPTRRISVNYLREGQKKHTAYGLFEVDVTNARNKIKEYREKTGNSISFTAFLLACLGKAIDENKIMHAYRLGRKKMIIFDEVDAACIIERNVDGEMAAVPYTIRAVNKRSLKSIHDEIRGAQSLKVSHLKDEKSAGDKAKAKKGNTNLLGLLGKLPNFIRKFIFYLLMKKPYLKKKLNGTIGITSIGMFTDGNSGWGIPVTPHALSLAVGGISRKPIYINETEFEPRDMLSLCLALDHDVVDGSPATRFLVKFIELVKEAYGMDEFFE